MRVFLALVVVLASACAGESLADVEQDVVSGVFTITVPPTAFMQNAVGILDTGKIAVLDGSVWLSAATTVNCTAPASIVACARQFNPAAPAGAMTWCTPVTPCSGSNAYAIPMSAFTADATHALALEVRRSGPEASVIGAALTEFTFGD